MLKIAGISIQTSEEQISFVSGSAIDGDGSGSSHGDPDFQSDTFYQPALNADIDQYIAVPPQLVKSVKRIVVGSKVTLENETNGVSIDAVVGDIGPHTKLGEISIAAAYALGIPSSPTKGGIEKHIIHTTIFPGIPAVVNNKTYQLQKYES